MKGKLDQVRVFKREIYYRFTDVLTQCNKLGIILSSSSTILNNNLDSTFCTAKKHFDIYFFRERDTTTSSSEEVQKYYNRTAKRSPILFIGFLEDQVEITSHLGSRFTFSTPLSPFFESPQTQIDLKKCKSE